MTSVPTAATDSRLPVAAYLAALAGIDGLGPRRLRRLLAFHDPAEAIAVLCGNHPPALPLNRSWSQSLWRGLRAEARRCDPAESYQRCVEAGVTVVGPTDAAFPAQLRCDPFPPAVLFLRGDPSLVGSRRVGIIGTRNATRTGIETARALGRDLSASGVAVISGLARGIDGAAHRGVLDADGRPIGVVANGLDRPYPAEHRGLWEQVSERGLLLSEWPLGTTPEGYRFPLRNRIVAALSEIIVVVESRERGGSMSTVREAALRDVQVMAVPGSPMILASRGTNQLLCDGAAPVTGVDDVLTALGLDTRRSGERVYDPRPVPSGRAAQILALCWERPRSAAEMMDVLDTAGIAEYPRIAEMAMVLARLERDGWLVESDGWFQAVGAVAGAVAGVEDSGSKPTETGAESPPSTIPRP